MTVFIKIKKYRLSVFSLIIVGMLFLVTISLFYLLFRTKKSLVIVIKANDESIIYPNHGIPNWYAHQFHKGMKEKDSFGRTSAEVTNVRRYDVDPPKSNVYLTVKLDVIYNRGTNQYTYKGRYVLMGSKIQLFLDDFLVDGLIVDVQDNRNSYPIKKLRVVSQIVRENPTFPETEGVRPALADSLHEGDIVKDNHGKTAIKIINKVVEDAKKTVITQNGNVLLERDPSKRDVYLTLEIWASQIGERYYLFNDIPILINYAFPIHLPKISVWPIILDIQD